MNLRLLKDYRYAIAGIEDKKGGIRQQVNKRHHFLCVHFLSVFKRFFDTFKDEKGANLSKSSARRYFKAQQEKGVLGKDKHAPKWYSSHGAYRKCLQILRKKGEDLLVNSDCPKIKPVSLPFQNKSQRVALTCKKQTPVLPVLNSDAPFVEKKVRQIANSRPEIDVQKLVFRGSLAIYQLEMRIETSPEDVERKLKKNEQLARDQRLLPLREPRSQYVSVAVGGGAKIAADGQFEMKTPFLNDSNKMGKASEWLNGTVGEAESIGRRPSQEDRHIAEDFIFNGQKMRLTGVFDGHGGDLAARFIQANFLQCLVERLNENGTLSDLAIYNALKIAFVDVDQLFSTHHHLNRSGSTATIALQTAEDLWVANLGDSWTIYINSEGQLTQLSEDMEFTPRFTQGVKKRHGVVITDSLKGTRVGGVLNVVRTVGDGAVPGISARCKVVKIKKPAHGYIVHGCDGITEVFTKSKIAEIIHGRITKGDSLMQAAKVAVECAFAAGSRDNLSVQIVALGP